MEINSFCVQKTNLSAFLLPKRLLAIYSRICQLSVFSFANTWISFGFQIHSSKQKWNMSSKFLTQNNHGFVNTRVNLAKSWFCLNFSLSFPWFNICYSMHESNIWNGFMLNLVLLVYVCMIQYVPNKISRKSTQRCAGLREAFKNVLADFFR